MTTIEAVHKDVEVLKRAVAEIKAYIEDCFLTAEEEANLENAREEFERRETISLEDLEQELDES